MRHADLHTGGGKLRDAIKTLKAAWLQADAHWRDTVRDEFEQNYIEPIEQHTHSVIDSIGHLAEVIARAEHECR